MNTSSQSWTMFVRALKRRAAARRRKSGRKGVVFFLEEGVGAAAAAVAAEALFLGVVAAAAAAEAGGTVCFALEVLLPAGRAFDGGGAAVGASAVFLREESRRGDFEATRLSFFCFDRSKKSKH